MLRGLLFCGVCTRRMQGSWNNGQAYYRCTCPSEYARTNHVRHPRVVYLREAEILPELDTWLSTSLDLARLPATIEALAASQDHAIPRELVGLQEEISTCDQKLAQCRAALDSGADAAVVGQWIAETQARKLAADARLRAATGSRPRPERMTKEQIAAAINAISDLMQALRYATTEDKAEIYAGLNLQLTYKPGGKTVNVSAGIGQTCTKGSCPRGDCTKKPMLARGRVRPWSGGLTMPADLPAGHLLPYSALAATARPGQFGPNGAGTSSSAGGSPRAGRRAR